MSYIMQKSISISHKLYKTWYSGSILPHEGVLRTNSVKRATFRKSTLNRYTTQNMNGKHSTFVKRAVQSTLFPTMQCAQLHFLFLARQINRTLWFNILFLMAKTFLHTMDYKVRTVLVSKVITWCTHVLTAWGHDYYCLKRYCCIMLPVHLLLKIVDIKQNKMHSI